MINRILYIILPLYISIYTFLWINTNSEINLHSSPNKDLIKTTDKEYADSVFSLANAYFDEADYNQARLLLNQAIPIYKKLNHLDKLAISLNLLGLTYYFQGHYNEALPYNIKSIETYEIIGDKKGVSTILNNVGAIYYFQGNYLKALDNFKKALNIQIEFNDSILIANLNQNIGGIYLEIKDFTNSMDYLEYALMLYEALENQEAISQCLNGIGEIYLKKGDTVEAYISFKKSISLAKKLNNKQLLMEVQYNMGDLYLIQHNYKQALYYMNNCLLISKDINSLRFLSISNIAIASILHETNRNSEAIYYAQKGLKTANEINAISIKRDAYNCLYSIHKSLGNSLKALKYYESKNAYDDSLRKDETANKILNMEFQKQALIDSLAHAKKEFEIQQNHREEIHRKEKQRNIFIASVFIVLILAVSLGVRLNYVRKSKSILQVEKDRSESLLLNILPEEIAAELKEKGYVDARDFNLVSILFTDFKEFTQTSEKLTPHELVEEINVCFKEFDRIVERYRLEKIKTIGDAYMAAGGLPNPNNNSVKNIVLAGLEMQRFICKRKTAQEEMGKQAFEMRLGIHAGPIVAGIVGVKKFQYDVWGDTVNTASRIETNGEVGKVNVSEVIYQLIKDEPGFQFEFRGLIKAKGKGEMKMYFVDNENMSDRFA